MKIVSGKVDCMGQWISSLVFRPPPVRRGSIRRDLHTIDVPSIGVRIPILYVRTSRSTARQTTLLFAHGNGEDLALIESLIRYTVDTLGVSVLAFEYPGYGESVWIDASITDPLLPSEARCYAAAEAAFDWLVHQRGIASTDVVLYGRSLGSGSAVHLAVRCAALDMPCGGLILQSPIASVVRVVMPRMCMTLPLIDMFANVDKAAAIKCRTTVIHGVRDRIVPVECARQLDAALPECAHTPALFIEGADHNDIELHRAAWCAHMNSFIALAVTVNTDAV